MIAQAGHFRFYYSAFTVQTQLFYSADTAFLQCRHSFFTLQTQLFYIAKTALSHCKISFFQL